MNVLNFRTGRKSDFFKEEENYENIIVCQWRNLNKRICLIWWKIFLWQITGDRIETEWRNPKQGNIQGLCPYKSSNTSFLFLFFSFWLSISPFCLILFLFYFSAFWVFSSFFLHLVCFFSFSLVLFYILSLFFLLCFSFFFFCFSVSFLLFCFLFFSICFFPVSLFFSSFYLSSLCLFLFLLFVFFLLSLLWWKC